MDRKHTTKAIRLSPMVPSANIQETKSFLTKALGFEEAMVSPDYVILTKDNYDLHICPAGDNIGQMSIYLEVDNLESTWEVFKSELTDGIRVREPFERDYGMKEFHADIPKTNTLLFVGQRVEQSW